MNNQTVNNQRHARVDNPVRADNPVKHLMLVLILMWAAEASAQHYVYYHQYHPVPEAFDGGFCEAEGVHPHSYAPVDIDYYVVTDGIHYFIGEPPVDVFEEVHLYQHHHPVPTLWGGGICYMVGPHRHWWAPGAHYHHRQGHWHYQGAWPRHYRPRRTIVPPQSAKRSNKFRTHARPPQAKRGARAPKRARPHYKPYRRRVVGQPLRGKDLQARQPAPRRLPTPDWHKIQKVSDPVKVRAPLRRPRRATPAPGRRRSNKR